MQFLRVAILLFIMLPSIAVAAEMGKTNLGYLRGDVQVYTEDTGDWVAASINMPLLDGDRLWVPEGARAELHIQGGIYLRLGSATALDIVALQDEVFQFRLDAGHAYINNRKGGIDRIQVDTPQSSVGCSDNSLVMVDVAEDGATEVAVLAGEASAETATGTASIDAGSTLHLGSDLSAEVSPLAPPDEWEDWNRERDREIAAGNRSLRYIPDQLEDYAYQFDNYGKWVYVTDYGYCWRPLTISADWSPYSSGRWVWVRGQYVWISYEPWGWVPHHYGRWAFVASFGWCWVPPHRAEAYWAPGYVGWVNTPRHVGWVPLAPGEAYYGYGYYGPNSVNISIAINQRHVPRTYRNVRVRRAVNVVDRSAFISGRREPVRGVNPFRSGTGEFAPPTFRPGRLGTVPVIKTIPPARKPPERIRRLSAPELRRERPAVHDRNGSAAKPVAPAASMPVKRRSEPQNVIRQQHPALPASKPPQRIEPAPRSDRQSPAAEPASPRRTPSPRLKPAPQLQPAPSLPQASPSATGITQPPKPHREPRWQEPAPTGKSRLPRADTMPPVSPASPAVPAAGTKSKQRHETTQPRRGEAEPRTVKPDVNKPDQPEKQQPQLPAAAPQTEPSSRRMPAGR